MKLLPFVFCVGTLAISVSAATPLPPPGADGPAQRAYQVAVLCRIADPVLTAGSEGRLKQSLPRLGNGRDTFAPLEALGRTLAGIAPWLELGPGEDAEGQLRLKYRVLATKAIAHAVDPASPDYDEFTRGGQPLVDAAFLAQGLLRAPHQLWGNLDEPTRRNVVNALKATRAIKPPPTNWELFSAMVEVALLEFTGECDRARIEKAVADHLAWYKGDGTYGDGVEFHWDYYNSYVIQPMLVEVVGVCARHGLPQGEHLPLVERRLQRYAEIQERLISPEGTFPIIGRSVTYRFGAFQALSAVVLYRQLSHPLSAGGVRAALTAVIRRMIEAPGTFDEHGWLTVGVIGSQPAMAETYISRGCDYLCTEGLLQLGLPADDPFWTEPSMPWTQQRLWSGENLPADHALEEDRRRRTK